MRILLFYAILLCLSLTSYSQANWVVTDINGNSHSVANDLAAGKVVVVKFFATWCSICWNDHQSGFLENMDDLYGPNGADTHRFYMFEVDGSTPTSSISGGPSSWGDWTAGHNVPIVENAGVLFGLEGSLPVPSYYAYCPQTGNPIEISASQAGDINFLNQNCPPVTSTVHSNFQAKVLLEGYTSGSTMNSNLADQGLLPTLQPFQSNPFNYYGTESFTTPPTDAVNWVLVELRDKNNESMVVDRKAGLLTKSGDIIDEQGNMGVTFSNASPDDYFVVIHHRGQVSVMTSSLVNLPNSSNAYDFTSSANSVKGNGQLKMANGTFQMRSGDFDNNGTVNFLDFLDWFGDNNVLNAYLPTDADGNGTINFLDFLKWLDNNNHLGYPGI